MLKSSQFKWGVARGGYQLVEARRSPGQSAGRAASKEGVRPGLFLTDGRPSDRTAPPGRDPKLDRSYRPLAEKPVLYRDFAGLKPTRESILSFANTYGLLGKPLKIEFKGATVSMFGEVHDDYLAWAESEEDWVQAIADLRVALELWDLVQAQDEAALSQCISWRSDGVWYAPMPAADTTEGSANERRIFDPRSRWWTLAAVRGNRGPFVLPALHFIEQSLNKKLRFVQPVVVHDESSGTLALDLLPHNLLLAMWVQFARAVDEDRRYRRCRTCGTWFELVPESARTNRLYCGETCRMKHYRQRRDEARKLFLAGYSIERIASELDVDAATAESWAMKGAYGTSERSTGQ